jgi:hypothetical protein
MLPDDFDRYPNTEPADVVRVTARPREVDLDDVRAQNVLELPDVLERYRLRLPWRQDGEAA